MVIVTRSYWFEKQYGEIDKTLMFVFRNRISYHSCSI